MMGNGEIESADDEMSPRGGQNHRPMVSHEGSDVQMRSMESRLSPEIPLKPIRIPSKSVIFPNTIEGFSHGHDGSNTVQRESKLELFGFDSLVNILGLKRF
ncbi:hypothetical protein ZIOFF_023101 [Zingiber officinale]|uniref:Uncharacterized protein n=1 Tax=Zingiber officinale TaxID=94328 RepID=A0A8J5LHT1_ZINOF|nr:hypothetical protein ZIOFF_023101 [Zingiber officinale]